MLQSEMSMITGMTQKGFNKTRFSQPFIEYFLCQPAFQDKHHSVNIHITTYKGQKVLGSQRIRVNRFT